MPCAYHPDRESVDTCSDCGKEICKFCKTTVDTRTLCPYCIEKLYSSSNTTTPETKGTRAGNPAYSHPAHSLRLNWILPILFLSGGIALIIYFFSDSALVIRNTLNNSSLGLASTSNVAPLPTSDWFGPDGETEYEYVSCGANCYYVGADGQPIVLVNNPDAKDPTWAELKNFLVVDRTDYSSYVYGSFTCGDFAEVLHNNAEQAGIRAAWAAIDFSDGGIGHANNAFNTTDEGLVYIDDTGIQDTDQIRNSGCARDRRASVSIGSDYTTESIFFCVWYDEWESLGVVSSISITW